MSTALNFDDLAKAIVKRFSPPRAYAAIDSTKYKALGDPAYLSLYLDKNRQYALDPPLDCAKIPQTLSLTEIPLKAAFILSALLAYTKRSFNRHLLKFNLEITLDCGQDRLAHDFRAIPLATKEELKRYPLPLKVAITALSYSGSTTNGIPTQHIFNESDLTFLWDSATPSESSSRGYRFL